MHVEESSEENINFGEKRLTRELRVIVNDLLNIYIMMKGLLKNMESNDNLAEAI